MLAILGPILSLPLTPRSLWYVLPPPTPTADHDASLTVLDAGGEGDGPLRQQFRVLAGEGNEVDAHLVLRVRPQTLQRVAGHSPVDEWRGGVHLRAEQIHVCKSRSPDLLQRGWKERVMPKPCAGTGSISRSISTPTRDDG